jgi:hypothetical protein
VGRPTGGYGMGAERRGDLLVVLRRESLDGRGHAQQQLLVRRRVRRDVDRVAGRDPALVEATWATMFAYSGNGPPDLTAVTTSRIA